MSHVLRERAIGMLTVGMSRASCPERPVQSDCPWIECSFLYNKPSPKAFQRNWQYRDDHHLMLQHDNARPPCCKDLYTIPGSWKHNRTCHPLSMFGMLWIGVYDSVFQFLPISSNFAQPLKRSEATFHRPESSTWSTLCEGDVLPCVWQMVVTPDTDWFSAKTKVLHL